jgi:hypothetical protein
MMAWRGVRQPHVSLETGEIKWYSEKKSIRVQLVLNCGCFPKRRPTLKTAHQNRGSLRPNTSGAVRLVERFSVRYDADAILALRDIAKTVGELRDQVSKDASSFSAEDFRVIAAECIETMRRVI